MAKLYAFNRLLNHHQIGQNSWIVDRDRGMTVLTTKPVKQALIKPTEQRDRDEVAAEVRGWLELYNKLINQNKI